MAHDQTIQQGQQDILAGMELILTGVNAILSYKAPVLQLPVKLEVFDAEPRS